MNNSTVPRRIIQRHTALLYFSRKVRPGTDLQVLSHRAINSSRDHPYRSAASRSAQSIFLARSLLLPSRLGNPLDPGGLELSPHTTARLLSLGPLLPPIRMFEADACVTTSGAARNVPCHLRRTPGPFVFISQGDAHPEPARASFTFLARSLAPTQSRQFLRVELLGRRSARFRFHRAPRSQRFSLRMYIDTNEAGRTRGYSS